jgi:autotransporter-associated beta strand protein
MPLIISLRERISFARAAFLILLLFTLAGTGRAVGRQVLHGNRPAVVSQLRALHDLATTNRLQLAIGLPLRNQAALTNLLADLYDPTSPNFHHFLTAAQFTEQFGPSAQDYQAVIAFAETNGFTVTGTHPNRMVLDVSARAPDVEKAFHLILRVYAHPKENRDFYAPDTDPQLDLAVPILHISGLNNYIVPRALNHERPRLAQTAQATPASGSGPSGTFVGKDFRAAYVPGVTLDGTGQSVALVQFAGYYASDISAYETAYGLPNVPLVNVLLNGIGSITVNAGGAEPALDIEMTISMATNLTQVITYYGSSADTIMSRIASDNLAKQISASWTFGIDATTLQIFQEFAAQGQSYFNASGDGDAYTGSPATPTDAPYVTSVGGTTLTTSGPGGAWVSEKVWNWGSTGSSGGVSTTYGIPLWQQGISMTANLGSTTMRNIPDVAMTADNVWVLYNNGGSGSFGGTSCASPLWAGFTALVNQQAAANGQPSIGFINPTVYALGKGTSYGSTFHDITTGNNTSPTSPGKFYGVTGYDLCTGWGTPTGLNLINALALSQFDPLVITGASGYVATGPVGGAFSPASSVYYLANYGAYTMNWSLINSSAWFNVSSTSGSLVAGASASVTLTVNAGANSLAAGVYSSSLLFSNASTHVVQSRPLTLVVGTGLTWNGGGGTGGALDGAGSWSDQSLGTDTNWWNGSANVQWNGAAPDIASFGVGSGTAGTVTLNSPVTAAGINFNATGGGNYVLAGSNPLTLEGSLNVNTSATISAPLTLGLSSAFAVANGQTLSISSLIGGATGNDLAITGPGNVVLTGQNNTSQTAGLAGAVTINSGTVTLNSGNTQFGTLGNVAGLTVGSGATLALAGYNAISGYGGGARNVTVNGGTLTDTGGNHALNILTLNGGTVSGTGSATYGSFNLNGDCFVPANATISAQNVIQSASSSFNAGSGATLTFSGTMIGSGGLTFAGPGTMIVSGANTYTGTTAIRAGTLQVGNGGAGGTLGSGPVVNSGLLQFNRSDNFIWTNLVSDPGFSGTFMKLNTDTLTLQSSNAFRAGGGGVAQVNGGILQINTNGTLTCGGEFWIAQNASTGACLINGGTLITSNWIAAGRNSSAAVGTLTINSGLIQKNGGGNIIMGSLGGTGTLTVNGGNVLNNAAIWLGENSTGKGTLNLNGGLTQGTQVSRAASAGASAIVNFNGGILQATTNQPAFLSVDQALVQAGGAVIDDGGFTVGVNQRFLNGGGAGGFTKNGSGTLILSSTNNTYAGGTAVNAGTLKLAQDAVLHFSFDNVSGNTVINDGTGGAAMNGTLIGSGAGIVSGGRYGNALSVNGIGGAALTNVVVVSNTVVRTDGTGSWTVAEWIKTATAGAAYLYQGDGGWTTGNTMFNLNQGSTASGGTRAGGVRYAGGFETGTRTGLNDNNWHFIVMTDNAGTKTLYVDGAVDAFSVNAWTIASVGGQVWIGGSSDNNSDGQAKINGLIDEVYMYGRALSSAEVLALMNGNNNPNYQVLPSATAVALATGATLDMSGLSQTVGSLAGVGGSSVLFGNNSNAVTLTTGNTTSTTFAGVMSGNGNLTKTGAGTLTLAGANTYAGNTTISAGTLMLVSGAALHFDFDNVSGVNVTNTGTSGTALNGVITGNVTFVPGKLDAQAAQFDGVSSYITIPQPLLNDFTISFWVKTTATGGSGQWWAGQGLVDGEVPGAANDFGTSLDGSHAAFGVGNPDTTIVSTTAINDGQWHQIAATRVAATGLMRLYVDGNLQASTTGPTAARTGPPNLRIGSLQSLVSGGFFNGAIDDVQLFTRALSQSDIQSLMNFNYIPNVLILPAATPLSLAAGATLNLNGLSQIIGSLSGPGGSAVILGDTTNAGLLTINGGGNSSFAGSIMGNGSLMNTGAGTLTLAGNNPFTGTTTNTVGVLFVNGSLGGTFVNITGGTLGGTGAIAAPTVVQAGATLAPGGNFVGTLTFSNSLTLSGATLIKLNPAGGTNDLVRCLGTLNCGGVLNVTNLAGTLAANASFQIFNAASFSGSFAATNLPSLAAGLAWDASGLTTSGIITVVNIVPLQFNSVSVMADGNMQLIFAGTSGQNYEIRATTNLTLRPMTLWDLLGTGTFGSGPVTFDDLQATNYPQRFYLIQEP